MIMTQLSVVCFGLWFSFVTAGAFFGIAEYLVQCEMRKKRSMADHLGKRELSDFNTVEELWLALQTYGKERDKEIKYM